VPLPLPQAPPAIPDLGTRLVAYHAGHAGESVHALAAMALTCARVLVALLRESMRAGTGSLVAQFDQSDGGATIASAIGVAEAALLMKEMIENTAALLVVGGIFALGFLLLTLPTGLLFGWLGKRWAVAR
jgi:glutamate transport system permease protein